MNNVEKLGVAALLIGVIAVGYSWDSRRKITQMYKRLAMLFGPYTGKQKVK